MSKQGFVIHHNGPNVRIREGDSHDRCIAYWNGVKAYHVGTKGWSDIAYSFGVCIHGRRFVGRGWDRNQFANGTDVVGSYDGRDSEWYTVLVFLGWNDDSRHPVDEEPSRAMVAGVRALIAEGRNTRRCGSRVLPHNAFKPKRCPGATFTAYAAQWNRAALNDPKESPDVNADQDARLKRIEARLNALVPDIPRPVDVHTGVLTADGTPASLVWRWLRQLVTAEHVDAAAIAAAIPDDLATQVADELAARLTQR